jgi:hypothetical protein
VLRVSLQCCLFFLALASLPIGCADGAGVPEAGGDLAGAQGHDDPGARDETSDAVTDAEEPRPRPDPNPAPDLDPGPGALPEGLGRFRNVTDDPALPRLRGLRETQFSTVDPEDPDWDGSMGEHTGAIAVDLDGDGNLEVIVFSEESFAELWSPARSSEEVVPHVLTYDRDAARLLPFAPAPRWSKPTSVPGAFADLDRDGFVDLSTAEAVPRVSWGGPSGFTRAREEASVGAAIAIAPFDVNLDGLLDIAIASASAELGGAYSGGGLGVAINVGGRRFEGRSYWFRGLRQNSYTVFQLPPLGGSTYIGTAMTENHLPGSLGFFALSGLDAECQPAFTDVRPPGLEDYVMNQPMGYAFGNLGDGVDALVIAENPEHALLRVHPDGTFEDITMEWNARVSPGDNFAECEPIGFRTCYQLPWGVAFADVDLDGRSDFIAAHGDDHFPFGPGSPAYVGPQAVTLHRNLGSLRFADVGDELGITDRAMFQGMAVTDLDEDGDSDIIAGGIAITPQVYVNDLRDPAHGLTLRLRGTASNSAGIGSRVEVYVAGRDEPQVLHVTSGGSPHVYAEPLVFAGLGDETRAAEVLVEWPTGLVERYADIAGGQVATLTETPPFEVLPTSRRLPADGASTATIRVLQGTTRAVDLLCPVGTLSGPRVSEDGAHEWTLRAPEEPGESVLRVRIDGEPLRVQPRVFWGD